jgi:predicted GIY-YIG superfamily endonuclease
VWYVYILRSHQDGRTYIGSTNDLKRRFKEHNDGLVTATKHRIPFILEAYVAVKTEEKARALEKYFKVGSGNAFLKKRLL